MTMLAALTGRSLQQVESDFAGRGYGDLKKQLAEVFVDTFTPFRDRTMALMDDQAALQAVLDEGAARASAVAGETLRAVYDRIGFVPRGR
jgi:tryptophanyl-tRNA synthetase